MHTSISVQNPWKGRSPQTSLPSPRLKQLQQSLSVSLSSRTEHWDRFVTYCKRYSLYSGQWQHFCSFVGSFCRYWPPNSLPPELCFFAFSLLHSNGFSHTLSDSYINPLQSVTLSSSPSQLMYSVPRGSVLGPLSLRPAHYASLSCIIANHSGNHQLFADDAQLQKSAPLSEVTSLAKELYACTDDMKTWMTENQLKLNDDKTEALSAFRLSWNLLPFPSLIQLFLALATSPLWFCQEPWIRSWLKTAHEEARHKNLPNCLFRAKTH